MNLLDRYLIGALLRTTALVLLLLTLLFAFFSLIDQLEDTGRGRFGVYNAIEYVVLTMPRTIGELFPIAAVIGAMTSLGLLARSSELTVIRAAGISRLRLLQALLKGGLILALVAVLISEAIAPVAEQAAQQRRSLALTDQIALKSRYGVWVRDGQSFINIRQVLADNRFRDVFIFEFDREHRLRTSNHAQSAVYAGGEWRLQNLEQTIIDRQQVRKRYYEDAVWHSGLRPDVINLVIVEPDYLSLPELFDYIAYLEANNQNTLRYRQALWSKLLYPFSILVLIALAVPLVPPEARSSAIGQRIFMGTLIGILFHLFNQAMSHLGVVFGLNPFFSAAVPILVALLALVALLRRSP